MAQSRWLVQRGPGADLERTLAQSRVPKLPSARIQYKGPCAVFGTTLAVCRMSQLDVLNIVQMFIFRSDSVRLDSRPQCRSGSGHFWLGLGASVARGRPFIGQFTLGPQVQLRSMVEARKPREACKKPSRIFHSRLSPHELITIIIITIIISTSRSSFVADLPILSVCLSISVRVCNS
ncbi:hypothetical protein VTK26DRAFT_844 [Humicola hyalothermophila]